MKIYFKLSILFIFLNSCHPDKYPGKALTLKNNSKERIYFWYSDNYTLYHLPDTILPTNMPLYINSAVSNGGAGAGNYDPDWNNIFSQLPSKKFSIYFFNKLAKTQTQ